MIVDKLENIANYSEIPADAVNFIRELTDDIKLGKYNIGVSNYANVESYITKNIDDAKFESHKNYIDIQILLSGKERIYVGSVNDMTISVPYSLEKDIMFYDEAVEPYDYITLGDSNFVMLFPHEAHAPQVAVSNPSEVKKVVVKIKI